MFNLELPPFNAETWAILGTLLLLEGLLSADNALVLAVMVRHLKGDLARKALAYLASTGIGDTAYFAPEAEFFIFEDVRYESSPRGSFYAVDSDEAWWNASREDEGGNLSHKTGLKGGYFPVSPTDKQADLRDEICSVLAEVGLEVERSHHEVGAAGQAEINYRFNTLTHSADDLQKFKYVVKNVANMFGKSATFMPKPVFGDNGSGMHCHQSLWNGGEPLFFDEKGYANLSDTARWYIGGLLKHASAVLAFTNPTVNSYRRLVPGFEAPINLVYSQRNRSAAIRIPITGANPKAKRIEFRAPDASGNPYLAFAAQLMAGLDGIRNRIEPAEPIDKDLYELPAEEAADIQKAPATLDEALNALEEDHEFLLAGDVFTEELIETWIAYKREMEIAPLALRPVLAIIEVISYFVRPVSHSIRLAGNLLAGHAVIKVFAAFAAIAVVAPVSILAIVGMYAFEVMVSVIQAYVFTILTCVYLKDALHPSH